MASGKGDISIVEDNVLADVRADLVSCGPDGFRCVPVVVNARIHVNVTVRVILPLLGEYCDAGYREPKDCFVYALRSNGRYQLITLGSGIVGAIYFFVKSGFHLESFKALVMALAYSWGLIMAIYLMGHGLVALPRQLFRDASVSGRLRRLQSQAPKIHDRLMGSIDKLDQYEFQVLQLQIGRAHV